MGRFFFHLALTPLDQPRNHTSKLTMVIKYIETLTNAGSMLAHRLRRWSNIDPTLAEMLLMQLPNTYL